MFVLYKIFKKSYKHKEFTYEFIENFKMDNSERKQTNHKENLCNGQNFGIIVIFSNHFLRFLQPLNLLFLSLLKGL